MFQISPDFKHLSQRERLSLQQLSLLGECYRVLQLHSHLSSSHQPSLFQNIISKTPKPHSEQGGVFPSLLALEINAILQEYAALIQIAETSFLQNRPLSLDYLIINFNEFFIFFHSLCKFLKRVLAKGEHGGGLLDFLYRKTLNGDSFSRNQYRRLFGRAYAGFVAMLSKWMLFGKVEDFFGEFFIKFTRAKSFLNSDPGIAFILHVSMNTHSFSFIINFLL